MLNFIDNVNKVRKPVTYKIYKYSMFFMVLKNDSIYGKNCNISVK